MPSKYRFIHEAYFQQHYQQIVEFFEGVMLENVYVPDFANLFLFDKPVETEQNGKVRGRLRHSPIFVIEGRQYSLGTDPTYEESFSEENGALGTEEGRDSDGFSADSVPFAVFPVRNPYDFSVDNWYYDHEIGKYASFRWLSKMPWKGQTVNEVVPYYRQDFINDEIIGFSLELDDYRLSFPFPPDDKKDLEYMAIINAPGPLYHRKFIDRPRYRKIFSEIDAFVREQVPLTEYVRLIEEGAREDFFRSEFALHDEDLRRLFSARRLDLTYHPDPDEETMRKVYGQLKVGGIDCNLKVLKRFCELQCGVHPDCKDCTVRHECIHAVDMV